MTVELATLISIVSISIAVYGAVRNAKNDNTQRATTMTTVLVKLEAIQSGITELKTDIKNIRTEVQDVDRRLTIAEQKIASRWKVIDSLKEDMTK